MQCETKQISTRPGCLMFGAPDRSHSLITRRCRMEGFVQHVFQTQERVAQHVFGRENVLHLKSSGPNLNPSHEMNPDAEPSTVISLRGGSLGDPDNATPLAMSSAELTASDGNRSELLQTDPSSKRKHEKEEGPKRYAKKQKANHQPSDQHVAKQDAPQQSE